MNEILRLWVSGQPFAQSRARVTRNGVYSSAGRGLKAWRASLMAEMVRACAAGKKTGSAGPLSVELMVCIPTKDTKRHWKWCFVKPDFDNLAKCVLDCMEDARMFQTGDQQVAFAKVMKVWCPPERAGVRIILHHLDAELALTEEFKDLSWLRK